MNNQILALTLLDYLIAKYSSATPPTDAGKGNAPKIGGNEAGTGGELEKLLETLGKEVSSKKTVETSLNLDLPSQTPTQTSSAGSAENLPNEFQDFDFDSF